MSSQPTPEVGDSLRFVVDNLRFLVLEVSSQVERAMDYLATSDPELALLVRERDDYIDQLKGTIGRKCLLLSSDAGTSLADSKLLRAIDVTTLNLERISDLCEDIVHNVDYAAEGEVAAERDFAPFAAQVLLALGKIDDAIDARDVQIGLQICDVEQELDDLFSETLRETVTALRRGGRAKRRVATIFVAHSFERMGDALLNIGEAVISALLGERVKVSQVAALGRSLATDEEGDGLDEISLEDVGETRSGCHITRVSDGGDGRRAIFKEGRLRKLRREKASIDRWQRLSPGLVPDVYSFHTRGDFGAILYEYLPGQTFEELLLGRDDGAIASALQAICSTMRSVWEKTRDPEPVAARFVAQLSQRLDDVYLIHPEFRRARQRINQREVPALGQLLQRARAWDHLAPPFSVLIHGDFNVDNVIYNAGDTQIRLIDLHRSRPMDYVQDISVFLVSAQRLHPLSRRVRRRVDGATLAFYRFASDLARDWCDDTFHLRLAIGLARSLITSTRFVLDKELASSLFVRADYLLRHVAACDPARPEEYRLCEEILVA